MARRFSGIQTSYGSTYAAISYEHCGGGDSFGRIEGTRSQLEHWGDTKHFLVVALMGTVVFLICSTRYNLASVVIKNRSC